MGKWAWWKMGLEMVLVFLTACTIIEQVQPLTTQPPSVVHRTATETHLSAFDVSSRAQTSLQISPNGRRIAYISSDGKGEFVMVDGKKESTFERIMNFPIFSPDSQHVAYIAQASGYFKQVVVVDGKVSKPYYNVDPRLCFSPDSQHFAYTAKIDEGHTVVVLDGKESRPYKYVHFTELEFSPDSQHLAYAASDANELFVVRDNKEEGHYAEINQAPSFSPNSRHLAFGAKIGTQWFAIIDGKQEGPYDQRVNGIIFSPDSEHYAYVAHSNNQSFVVWDGKAGKAYDEIVSGVLFSPDSKHLVYGAKVGSDPLGTKMFVVLDGKESKAYSGLRLLGWTAHGEHLIYLASLGSKFPVVTPRPTTQGPLVALAPMPLGNVVVIDDQEVAGPYHIMEIGDLNAVRSDTWSFGLFPTSPDGKHYALAARKDPSATGPQFIVMDGKEGKPYDEIIPLSSRFSYDSRRLVYAARNGSQQFVVVDGIEGKAYDRVIRASVVFSPDSQHLVYAAQSGNYQFVVLDNTEGKAYDEVYVGSEMGIVIGGRKVIFDSANTFHYLARQGNEIYLIQEKIQ